MKYFNLDELALIVNYFGEDSDYPSLGETANEIYAELASVQHALRNMTAMAIATNFYEGSDGNGYACLFCGQTFDVSVAGIVFQMQRHLDVHLPLIERVATKDGSSGQS